MALNLKTEQRRAIRRVVERADGPLSAQDVLDAAQHEVPGLGIATVYRNLKAMVESGELQAVELPGQPSRYEIAGKKHHHHFHCDACGRVLDISGCARAIEKATPKSFEVERHDVVLYGRCPECAQD